MVSIRRKWARYSSDKNSDQNISHMIAPFTITIQIRYVMLEQEENFFVFLLSTFTITMQIRYVLLEQEANFFVFLLSIVLHTYHVLCPSSFSLDA